MIYNNNKTKVIISLICTFVVFISAVMFFKKNSVRTDNAYLKSDIVIIKPKVTGYIVETLIEDNQKIKAEQVIAKIDGKDYELKLNQAQANLQAIEDKLNSLMAQGEIKNIEINKALLKQNSAKVSFEIAERDFQRALILVKDKAISQQDFDKKTDLQNSLKNEYASAESSYRAALLSKKINDSEIKETENLLVAAQANFELAKIDLENTSIKAATDGVIIKKSLQVGQLVSPQLALAYLVQNNIWIIANFKETQIENIKVGDDAIITIDSFLDKKFRGKVDSLSPATGSEFSILPPENATGNFTKIVQRVPIKIIFNEDENLSELKSGLSCEVKIEY